MNKFILAAAAASTIVVAAPASAAVITFDEVAPQNGANALPANQYSSLGVTIQATDDSGTWGGNSAGNPGNWGLQGTNGAAFSGFNGDSYSMSLLFATNITSISLDASRSNGSQDGTITLQGFLNGSLVNSTSVGLGAINTWSTLGLTGVFDKVTISGTGTGFHPFGIDNINFSGSVPEPATWAMMLLGFGGIGLTMRRRRAPLAQLA